MLPAGQVSERRGEELPVGELAHAARAVSHRGAGIEQQYQVGIGLADIALDVGALRAREHVPVDEARIVALGIGAILRELLAEAEERRTMQPGQEAFGDDPGDEIEIGQARQHLRLEQVFRRGSRPCAH